MQHFISQQRESSCRCTCRVLRAKSRRRHQIHKHFFPGQRCSRSTTLLSYKGRLYQFSPWWQKKVTFNLLTRDGARETGLASPQLRLLLNASLCPASPDAGGLPQQKSPLTDNKVVRWRRHWAPNQVPVEATVQLGKNDDSHGSMRLWKVLPVFGLVGPLSGEPPRNDTVLVSTRLIITAAIHRVTPVTPVNNGWLNWAISVSSMNLVSI